MISSLSDNAVLDALVRGNIFPHYQPIVDKNKNILGYELLMRWRIDDKIIPPNNFIPYIHSEHVWQQLTEIMINSAVSNIIRLPDESTFAVNLPKCLLRAEWVEQSMSHVKSLLIDRVAMSRLVFEINESITLTKMSHEAQAVSLLRESGCRVYLDDCFGETSVIFPVKSIPLDGFKIDKSIVDTFQHCAYHRYFIQALVYFCHLNQIVCIAEGVDSWDKFESLVALGVNGFQGYLLGIPNELNLP